MSKEKHVVLIGPQEEIYHLADEMQAGRGRCVIDAIFTTQPEAALIPEKTHPYSHEAVMTYLNEHTGVTDVYASAALMGRHEMAELFYACEERRLRFSFLPLYVGSLRRNMRAVRCGHVSLLRSRPAPLSLLGNRLLKRGLDILLSLLLLLTVFPVIWVVWAIAVKRRHGGPVFARTKCSGPDGRVFHRLSFSESAHGAPFRHMPQLLNVMQGEMSLVGPSARTATDIEDYFRQADPYHVSSWPKPGMTGWARVADHSRQVLEKTPLENEVSDDIWYVQNWTLGLDLSILLRAFGGRKNQK